MAINMLNTSLTDIKKKILLAGIRQHQILIDDFKQSIKEIQASEGKINEEDMDLTQQGYNNEMDLRINALADHLRFANEEMRLLYDMLPIIGYMHHSVQAGSVVITDKRTFFVAASIEAFEVDGTEVFGLSTNSPLYKAMEGKTTGDTFGYNKVVYHIREIF